jgi:sulfate adenylyltransferase
MIVLSLKKRQYLEFEKIALGAFAPLHGFMDEADFLSVVERLRLASGEVFPLPVVLDVDETTAGRLRIGEEVSLSFNGERVGRMVVQSVYRCEPADVTSKIYGTDDSAHPGVAHFARFSPWFVGGPVSLDRRATFDFSRHELTPAATKAMFAERGWKTIAGFQTRNVPHRAHEYLQRVALELVDGLFIQPLVGYKKRGDYQPAAILTGYETLLNLCFPPTRVVLGVLSTSMRYAGPREALFHALIRRNYGCTHFIVGRDHAGVGSYYGKYDAHALTRKFEGQLGIQILRLNGPFYCRRCQTIATEKTCRHVVEDPEATHEISGTDMRRLLSDQAHPSPELMRPEIVASLEGMSLFVEEDDL